MNLRFVFSFLAIFLIVISSSVNFVNGAIRNKKGKGRLASGMRESLAGGSGKLHNIKEKDKKNSVNKQLKKHSDMETLKEWIDEVDSSGVLRRVLRRKLYIPRDSSLSLSFQVSRPNIFPNIFNQGEGFIVDAVIEWPIWLDLHLLSEAVNGNVTEHADEGFKSDLNDFPANQTTDGDVRSQGKAFSGPASFIGIERCLIYDKLEVGMSVYLDIPRNMSHDCVLRAVCEAQMVAEFYPDAPHSIFFEVVHLILKPSLSQSNHELCYKDYLLAEKAAYQAPTHCTPFVSKCPLNIAGLFVRNFFPEIL